MTTPKIGHFRKIALLFAALPDDTARFAQLATLRVMFFGKPFACALDAVFRPVSPAPISAPKVRGSAKNHASQIKPCLSWFLAFPVGGGRFA
jgi:hypothetical protein